MSFCKQVAALMLKVRTDVGQPLSKDFDESPMGYLVTAMDSRPLLLNRLIFWKTRLSVFMLQSSFATALRTRAGEG
jgi:hypothetical protein